MKKPSGEAIRLTSADRDIDRRFLRMRRLAWLLDRSISIGGFRFGLDPLIGLVPGAGDLVGGSLSTWIIYESARLGVPVRVLFQMVGNVLIDLIVGAVPLVGDMFDFVWRANVRNLRLVERHYDPQRATRPRRRIIWAITALMIAIVVIGIALTIFIIKLLWQAIDRTG